MNNQNEKLVEGNTYRLGGYDWIVAEIRGNCAVLQSCGVTSGSWPGFTMPEFGAGDEYDKDIDGLDIHTYDDKMLKLYDKIKDVEFNGAEYGRGLFLVSNTKAGQTFWGEKGSGYYWEALTTAAKNHSSFGASGNSWLGSMYGSGSGAWFVYQGGYVSYDGPDISCVVAPAFNLSLSKIEVNGDIITIRENAKPDDSSESQSTQSVMENQTADKNAPAPAYRPKFTDDTCRCLLLDSVWDADGCLVYADAHNMDVLYTETKAADALKILMAFQKKGFRMELRERKNVAPDGLVLDPKVEVYLTKN